jgi:hypothetical protein
MKQQEEYDNRQRKHIRYNERSLYRAGISPSMLEEGSDEDVAAVALPPWTTSFCCLSLCNRMAPNSCCQQFGFQGLVEKV